MIHDSRFTIHEKESKRERENHKTYIINFRYIEIIY